MTPEQFDKLLNMLKEIKWSLMIISFWLGVLTIRYLIQCWKKV